MYNLFSREEKQTEQIMKIKKGIIQKNMTISKTTKSADRGRILMIRYLQNDKNNA